MIKLNLNFLKKFSILTLKNQRITENILYYGDNIERIRETYKKLLTLIPAIIIISLIIGFKISKYFLLLDLSILFIYFYPLLLTEIRKEEHRKTIENEISVFLLFAYINSLLGKSLYKTFEEITHSSVFKGLSKEAILLIKEVEILGKSSISAIENRARIHRSDFLGKVYTSYLNGELIGISPSERLRRLLDESVDSLKTSFENYITRVSDIVEIIFLIYLVMPMILLAFQYISANSNLFVLIIPLLISPIIYLYILILQPNIGYEINLNNYEKKILFGIPAFLLLLIIHFSLLYLIIGIYSLFTLLSYTVYRRIKYSDDILNNLPYALSDISDYIKLGYSVRNSLGKISSNNINFRKFLSQISDRIRRGYGISSIKTNMWIVNSILELIDSIERKGFADSFVFKEISLILDNYITIRKKIMKELNIFNILSIITPILLFTTFAILSKIKFIASLDTILVTYSIVLGIIYAKLARFTVFNFPLLASLLAVIIIVVTIPNSLMSIFI
ncbi:MAG: type II secretion system F family protein [Saccharolobus sp.]